MNDVESDLIETVTNPEFIPAISEFAKVGLGAIFESELVQVLPVIKSIHTGMKGISTMQDRVFVKKLSSFLLQANQFTIEEKNAWYKKHIGVDSAKEEKLAEKLIIIIDSVNDTYKAKIIGKLFWAFVIGRIETMEEFFILSEIVESCFTNVLSDLAEGKQVPDEVLFRAGIMHASPSIKPQAIVDMLDEQQRSARSRMTRMPQLREERPGFTAEGRLLVNILQDT